MHEILASGDQECEGSKGSPQKNDRAIRRLISRMREGEDGFDKINKEADLALAPEIVR